MSQPLEYGTSSAPARWTGLSVAAVLCCILFALSVAVAAVLHPQIPGLLIAAILALPIGAIVFGILARRQSKSQNARGARPAVVLGIIAAAILLGIAVLLPSLCRAREPANRVKCASNLRQIGQALQEYASSHDGQFPPTIEELAAASDLPPAVFNCPSSNDSPANLPRPGNWSTAFRPADHHLSYIYVAGGLATSTINADTVLAYENLANHLDEGMNVLFGDYHVEWMTRSEANRILAEHPASQPATTRSEN